MFFFSIFIYFAIIRHCQILSFRNVFVSFFHIVIIIAGLPFSFSIFKSNMLTYPILYSFNTISMSKTVFPFAIICFSIWLYVYSLAVLVLILEKTIVNISIFPCHHSLSMNFPTLKFSNVNFVQEN